MRVLIVSRASYPLPASQGGTDAYALRTATYLVPLGHEVYLVGQGSPGPAFGAVRFIRVPTARQVTSRYRPIYFLKGFLLNITAALTAIKFLRSHRSEIDVVHCNSNVGVLVLRYLFPEKPMVFTLHDPLFRPTGSPTLLERLVRSLNNGVLERLALRRADHVIAVSPEIRRQAERVLGSPSKLTLLYPLPRPSPNAGRGSPPEPPVVPGPYVLSVGAQTGRKRFDLLIRAMAGVPEPVQLVLVGAGSDRPHLVRTAHEAGLSGRVEFIDRVTESEIERLYRGALVYAMASTREGFPTTLIEAALSGTPTLYFTDSGTLDSETFQSDFFRVVPTLDESAIADALRSACSRSLTGTVDRAGIASWARDRFPTPEAAASEIGRIYEDVAETPA